jgi:nucleotide-binding universal stress UspA family protein
MSANYLIVVGVDGSEGGRPALDWAAQEAASRGGVPYQVGVLNLSQPQADLFQRGLG